MGLGDPSGVRTVFMKAFLPWGLSSRVPLDYYWAAPTGPRRLLRIRDRILGNGVISEVAPDSPEMHGLPSHSPQPP